MSNRTLTRALACSLIAVALVLTTAGCTSSKSSDGPTSTAPPTVVPSSRTGHGKPVNLKKLLLRHAPGTFKQKPDAGVNAQTGFSKAIQDDPRKPKKARRTLHRDRFLGTYERAWTGFGDSTIRIILDQFTVVGGPRAYQPKLSDALKKELGETTPVTVPGVPSATGFTQKTKKRQSTFIIATVGLVMMQVRATGKVALGQVATAVSVATRQYKRL